MASIFGQNTGGYRLKGKFVMITITVRPLLKSEVNSVTNFSPGKGKGFGLLYQRGKDVRRRARKGDGRRERGGHMHATERTSSRSVS